MAVRVVAIQVVGRPGGVRHEIGAEFSLSEEDAVLHLEQGLVALAGAAEAAKLPDVPVGDVGLDALLALWDVEGMTPAEYLQQFPEGPMSDLALGIVEAQNEAAEAAKE